MRVILKIIQESFSLAKNELLANKLRSFLSVLGIAIGIFCIVSVWTAVDSLESNIRGGFSKLGNDVVYVQKWPWSFGEGEYKWWEYYKRPSASVDDYAAVLRDSRLARNTAFVAEYEGQLAEFGGRSISDMTITMVSRDYGKVFRFEFLEGRDVSPREYASGKSVCVIGYDVAQALFPGTSAINKKVRFMNKRFSVVGVLQKDGESLIGISNDDQIFFPFRYGESFKNLNENENKWVAVAAKDGSDLEELKNELTGILRQERNLNPKDKDNFALNQLSIVSKGISLVFSRLQIAGLMIGFFSLLVGGFGLANIMFVSVKERTGLIGIKKALGARKFWIMIEFLIEAILLCLFGGLLGLLGVFTLSWLANQASDFQFILTWATIQKGLIGCVVIGIISGIIPALQAARMHPVEAIRFK